MLARLLRVPYFEDDRAVYGHIGYLLLWVVVGWWLAERAFRHRLER